MSKHCWLLRHYTSTAPSCQNLLPFCILFYNLIISIQYFAAVGWVTGTHSGCKNLPKELRQFLSRFKTVSTLLPLLLLLRLQLLLSRGVTSQEALVQKLRNVRSQDRSLALVISGN